MVFPAFKVQNGIWRRTVSEEARRRQETDGGEKEAPEGEEENSETFVRLRRRTFLHEHILKAYFVYLYNILVENFELIGFISRKVQRYVVLIYFVGVSGIRFPAFILNRLFRFINVQTPTTVHSLFYSVPVAISVNFSSISPSAQCNLIFFMNV